MGARVTDARVLDLYAGSGGLGLEALSRGATDATFVERDRAAVSALRSNVEAVDLGGSVVVADVELFVARRTAGPFDLVFVDPPYAVSLASVETLLEELLPMLADHATVIVHRRRGDGIPDPVGYELDKVAHYGTAEIVRLVRS